jgi:hypothetical protein
MKKLVILFIIIFCSGELLQAQNLQRITTWYHYKLIEVDTLGIPIDTVTIPLALRNRPWLGSKDSVLYIWSVSKQKYMPVFGSGGGGPVAFADIQGAPSSNTALNSALNAKQNSLPVGTVSQYYAGNQTLRNFSTDIRAVGDPTYSPIGHTHTASQITDFSIVARNLFHAGTGISYDPSTGMIVNTAAAGTGLVGHVKLPVVMSGDTLTVPAIDASTIFGTKTSTFISDLQTTVLAFLSGGTGILYNNTTGVSKLDTVLAETRALAIKQLDSVRQLTSYSAGSGLKLVNKVFSADTAVTPNISYLVSHYVNKDSMTRYGFVWQSPFHVIDGGNKADTVFMDTASIVKSGMVLASDFSNHQTAYNKTITGGSVVNFNLILSRQDGTNLPNIVLPQYGPGNGLTLNGLTFNVDATKYYTKTQTDSAYLYRQQAVNFKKDSVLLYTFNTLSQTPTSMGWTKGSNYSTTATETNVSDGLQIVSTSNQYANNLTYSSWKSMASDVTLTTTMRIVSWGGTLAVAGVYFGGTTALLPRPGNAFINLVTGQVYLYTYEYGQFPVGTLVNPVAVGDRIRFSVRRNFAIYTVTVTNLTKSTTEVFTRDETTDPLNNGVAVNNWNPGILIMNATVVYQDFKFYSTTGYNPDYMVLGASIQQNQWKLPFDSSFVGRLQANSNKIITLEAGAGMNDQDVMDILPEVYKLKPKSVIWGDIAYNDVLVSGQSTSTWLPLVKTIGDSLMNHGIKLIVEKNPPSNNTVPAGINLVIDSVFTNNRRIKILDDYKVFPLWDSSQANNCNTAYTLDGKHLNSAGGKVLADYTMKSLESLEHWNVESAADFQDTATGGPKDLRMQAFDSLIKKWVPLRMLGVTRVGNTISFPGGGAGITLAYGSYTPTVSSTTNVTTYTLYALKYTRVGDQVTVSGQIDAQAAAANTPTFIRISIPIANSGNFTSRRDANGVINSEAYYGAGVIYGLGATQTVEMSLQAPGLLLKDYHFIYTYSVF